MPAGSIRTGKPGALLLAPGAGATRDSPTLVAIERAAAPLPCRRMDFPYRAAAKRVPDKAPVAIAEIGRVAADLILAADIDPAGLVLGGRSYGGRMCSMAVAEGLPAAGLVLLSYPLHPPGRPEKLRVEHFPAISVPVLFLSGERDPFGSPAEFAANIPAIQGPVTQVWVTGGHLPRGDERVAAAVVEWLRAL